MITNETLKNEIAELLKIKPVRYMSRQFLGEDMVNRICGVTSFLQDDHGMQERIYCIANDINEHPKCPCCNKEVDRWHKFDDLVDNYVNNYCSTSCSRTYMSCISNFNIDESAVLPKDELVRKINELHDSDKNYRISDSIVNGSIHYYLKQMNIACSKFSISQSARFIIDGLTEIPKCPVCGNDVNYHNGKLRWETYCSSKCSANSHTTVEKRHNTNMEKYGVVNVFQSEDIKKKSDMSKLLKYGDAKYTNKDKALLTINRTTYDNMQRFSHICIPLFSADEFEGCSYDRHYQWKCTICDKTFSDWYNNGEIPRCPSCNKLLGGNSGEEKELFEYVDGLICGKCSIVKGSKKIIAPHQLDIYLPERKFAIEFNGLYWHCSDRGYGMKYHLNKTEKCLEKDIRLIHVFEDEWLYKKRIVKTRLKAMLGLTSYSIYARKCHVEEITTELKDKFLNKYHIQGKDNTPIRYGLYYGTRLVAVMTFSKNRHDTDGGYELVRYATIGDFNIVGGAGKLLSHFENHYKPSTVTTFADRRWSVGNLYHKIGFTLSHTSPPSYWYFTNNKRVRMSRERFQKYKLKDMLSNFDETLTEADNMKNAGYMRIFDCGTLVFKKERKVKEQL